MSKMVKISKKVLSLCLSMFLCINSFAAIVADNDGSAFTTKAEFEAMKQDFANQVNSYQSSIEGKIDGAIASYLAGIRTTRTVIATNYFTNAKANNAKNLAFIRWKTPQAYKNVQDVRAGYSVVNSRGSAQTNNRDQSGYYGYCQIANAGFGNGGYNECEYLGTSVYSNYIYNDAKSNWTSAYYWVHFPFKGENEKTNLSDFTLQDVKRHRLYMHLVAQQDSFTSAQAGSSVSMTRYTGTVNTDYTSLTQPGSFNHANQGSNGPASMTPICSQTHTWSDTSSSDTTNNAFLEYNIATAIPSSTFYAVEYEYRDYYNSADSNRWTASSQNLQIQSAIPGSNLGSDAWKHSGSSVSFKKQGTGYGASGSGVTFKFKFNEQKKFALNWQRITNAYYNNLFGEPYYKYYGIPITDMIETGKVTFTLNLTNSTADSFTYSIMDKRHINGAIQTTLKETYSGVSTERVLAKGTLSTKKTHVVNVAFDKKVIWDKTKGDYIYLKVEPSVAGQIVTADIPGSVFIEYKTY